MSLQNSIFSSLFQHLQKPKPQQRQQANVFEQAEAARQGDDSDDGILTQKTAESPLDFGRDATRPRMANDILTQKTAESDLNFSEPQTPAKPEPPQVRQIADSPYVPKTLSPLEQAQMDFETAASAPAPKQGKWWSAFAVGLQAADKFFNHTEGDIKSLGEIKKQKSIKDAAGRLAPLQQQEAIRIKQAKDRAEVGKTQLETQGVGLSNQGKEINNQKELFQTLLESLKADGRITESEAAYYKAKTGMDVSDYDARKFDTKERNGTVYSSAELGTPDYKPVSTLPIEQGDTEKNFKVDGVDVTTSTNKILPTIAANANNNASRQQSAAQFKARQEETAAEREYRSEKDYSDDVFRHAKDVQEAKAKFAGAKKMLEAAQANREALKGYDTTEVDKQIAQAQRDMAEAEVLMNAPAPKKIIRSSGANSKGTNSINSGTFRSAIQKVKARRQ